VKARMDPVLKHQPWRCEWV